MYTFKLLSGHPSDEILGRTDTWTCVRGYSTYIYAHTKTEGETTLLSTNSISQQSLAAFLLQMHLILSGNFLTLDIEQL